jgi:hypothetical protein
LDRAKRGRDQCQPKQTRIPHRNPSSRKTKMA